MTATTVVILQIDGVPSRIDDAWHNRHAGPCVDTLKRVGGNYVQCVTTGGEGQDRTGSERCTNEDGRSTRAGSQHRTTRHKTRTDAWRALRFYETTNYNTNYRSVAPLWSVRDTLRF